MFAGKKRFVIDKRNIILRDCDEDCNPTNSDEVDGEFNSTVVLMSCGSKVLTVSIDVIISEVAEIVEYSVEIVEKPSDETVGNGVGSSGDSVIQ